MFFRFSGPTDLESWGRDYRLEVPQPTTDLWSR